MRRRNFIFLSGGALAAVSSPGQETVTFPGVSEETCPIQPIAPVARDGFTGQALVRIPPGQGPFPDVVYIHGGLVTVPAAMLRKMVLGSTAARFFAAGYVTAVPTYRSRNRDPQSTVSLED